MPTDAHGFSCTYCIGGVRAGARPGGDVGARVLQAGARGAQGFLGACAHLGHLLAGLACGRPQQRFCVGDDDAQVVHELIGADLVHRLLLRVSGIPD